MNICEMAHGLHCKNTPDKTDGEWYMSRTSIRYSRKNSKLVTATTVIVGTIHIVLENTKIVTALILIC